MIVLLCLLLSDGSVLFARVSHGAAAEQPAAQPREAASAPAASWGADIVTLCPVSSASSPLAVPAQPAPPYAAAPAALPDPASAERAARLEAAAQDLQNIRGAGRLTRKKIDAILETLPDDLDLGRTLIVLKAYSLIGEVEYQWGGKSSALGWDRKWNGAQIRTDENGAVTTVENGLDCSGFVRWCFINASGTADAGRRLGSGTYKQWINSTRIRMEDALPGDLVFINEVGRTNHNGIVVQNDGDGTIFVIHCAAGKGVALERAESAGFTIARRPEPFLGENLERFEESAIEHKQLDSMADLRYLLAWKESR